MLPAPQELCLIWLCKLAVFQLSDFSNLVKLHTLYSFTKAATCVTIRRKLIVKNNSLLLLIIV
jgi:hypothetical protein